MRWFCARQGEYTALLHQYQVLHTEDFGPSITSQMNEKFSNWTIPSSELANRRDLRDKLIFTIDPCMLLE